MSFIRNFLVYFLLFVLLMSSVSSNEDVSKIKKYDIRPYLEVASYILFPIYIYALSEKPEVLGLSLVFGVGMYDKATVKDATMFCIPAIYDFTLAKGRPKEEVFLTNIGIMALVWWLVPEVEKPLKTSLLPNVSSQIDKTTLAWNYQF